MSAAALRAPREHGQILAVPPLCDVSALLDANRRSIDSVSISSLGKSFSELRALARREALTLAADYLREAGQTVAPASAEGGPWLIAGHQPELFHPGVWIKNFALHQLAAKHQAVAINLVIDTDAAKPTLLHAPSAGKLARVPFDRSALEMPYEERVVVEESTFADLPRQMAAITSKWPFAPMLPAYWRHVMRHAERTPLLGERLAAARRDIERSWGVVQREVPMSRICGSEAFAWFACAILDRLPAFHAAYNDEVHDYRQAHGIKSRSHPVPDLASDGEWLEAPFWAWRTGQARRGRLFVRRIADAWQLRVGGEPWPSIPAGDLDRSVNAWRSLQADGHKIRSRALTTTMFSRLFLADLFIHGIGGGIYDSLTDRILERFFAIPAPAFLVLSATLLLPLPRFPDARRHLLDLERQGRDVVYKPERFVSASAEVEPLLGAKRAWITRACGSHAERIERFRQIRDLNARLLPFVSNVKQQIEADHAEQQHRVAWDAVAARRDYAFCLYPEEMLREFFATRIFV